MQHPATKLVKIKEEKITHSVLFRPIMSRVRLTAHCKVCIRVFTTLKKELALKIETVISVGTAESLEHSIWRIPESRNLMQSPTAKTQQEIILLVIYIYYK